jgi:hypothetical protein
MNAGLVDVWGVPLTFGDDPCARAAVTHALDV